MKRNVFIGSKKPLSLELRRGEIVIRIGVETCAAAFELSEENNPYDEKRKDFVQAWLITDFTEFSKDVIAAMSSEAEDGSTPLSDFLDEMMRAAADNGSTAIEADTSGLSAWAKDGH